MSDAELTPGQQVLVDSLEALNSIALDAAAEPAPTFAPSTWASKPEIRFDLEKLAAAAAGTPPAEAIEPCPAPPATIPPACPTLAEIVAAVTSGETTAAQTLEVALARIAACNPSLNAMLASSTDRAREEAAAVDDVVAAGERPRPLSGVPLLHKDIIATRGIRTTAGSRVLAGYIPSTDATVVGRLSNAGTLLLGKAATHEFATGTTGTVSAFGPTRNPWNLDHISGGSSCGSAAALAAGMVAAATGTDTGGSIRIPSACCGTVGFKPTYGRVSRTGVIPFAWGLDHVGPMATRVADIGALLTAMAGPDPFDRASAQEPAGDFSSTLGDGIQGLRFAVPEPCFLDLAGAPVAAAVRDAAGVLESLGARRVDVEMPAEMALVGPAAIAIFLAEGGAVHRTSLATHGDLYGDETRSFLQLAGRVDATTYLQAQRLRALLSDAMARLFQAVDLLVTPTLPTTAPRADAATVEGAHGPLEVRAAMTLFTRPFNLTGLPALSLPCGFDGGLPIGLQLVGRAFDERTVLRAGACYEAATAWHQRRPTLFP